MNISITIIVIEYNVYFKKRGEMLHSATKVRLKRNPSKLGMEQLDPHVTG